MPVVVAGAVINGASLLIAQRSKPTDLAGLWELPGGKVGAAESEPDALRREMREELGIEISVGPRLGADVLTADLTLRAYRAELVGGTPHPHEHLGLRWVRAEELDDVEWVPADREWVDALHTALVSAGAV